MPHCLQSSNQLPIMFTPPPLTETDFQFHELFDHQAVHQASHPFYAWLDDSSSHVVEVSHLEFDRAGHRAAALLFPSGPQALTGEKIGLFALAHHIHYQAVFLGLLRAGVTVSLGISSYRCLSNVDSAFGDHALLQPGGSSENVHQHWLQAGARVPEFEQHWLWIRRKRDERFGASCKHGVRGHPFSGDSLPTSRL